MVTQKDIAKELGVSQSSVACAFHPTLYTQISKARRERIIATARAMGYVPNRAGRRLALARTDSQSVHFDQVGLIYVGNPARHQDSVFSDSVFLSMMQGAERELSDRHVALTFVRVETPDDWSKIDHLATGGGVDGWMVYGPMDDDSSQTLASGLLPWVVLGDHTCTGPVHAVNVEHQQVTRTAVEHLHQLGHRRVAYLTGSMRLPYQRACLAGFRAAVQEFGMDADESLISTLVDRKPLTHKELVQEMMDRSGPLPTAIVTGESGWAEPVIKKLQDLGHRVPEDVSVVGSESTILGRDTITVSRVDVPMAQVGAEGARLLERIVRESPDSPQRTGVEPSLTASWSSAPPRD